MRNVSLLIILIGLILSTGCAHPSAPSQSLPPGLSVEEHLLAHSPEAEYSTLDFAEGNSDEILAKHADERALIAGYGTSSCIVANQMAYCTRLGEAELAAWTEYGGLLNQGKVVVTLNGKQIYTIGVGDSSPIGTLRGFGVYEDHWVLETANIQNHLQGNAIISEPVGQITIDGTLLNKQKGYQEAFGFQTMRGSPLYFFKRDGKIGVSLAGREADLGYDEVLHYGCCSAGTLNPQVSQNMVAFFARKGSQWYYIEAGVFASPTASPN